MQCQNNCCTIIMYELNTRKMSWIALTGVYMHIQDMCIVLIARLATIPNVILSARSERMNRWFGSFTVDCGKGDGIADIYRL